VVELKQSTKDAMALGAVAGGIGLSWLLKNEVLASVMVVVCLVQIYNDLTDRFDDEDVISGE
jgi:hypothetical protein